MSDLVSKWYSACYLKSEFNPESKFHDSAKIYSGAKFRPQITLIMEEDTFIGTNAVILVPKLVMKRGSQINAGAILTGKEPIVLGENVVIGYQCTLLTATDTPQGKHMSNASPETERAIRKGPIIIEKNSFIGSMTLIMPGVKVGENTVVGAQTYVDKDLPNDWIYFGNIALFQRRRRPEERVETG